MRKIAILLTLAVIIASCQNGSVDPPDPLPNRIRISPTIALPDNSPVTRATELSFEQRDKIGVTITREDQTTYVENAPMTFSNGVFTGDVDWYEGTENSHVTACYPYSAAGMPALFSVATDQTTGYGASDLMGAIKRDAAPSDAAVSMTFKHLMAKIVVKVTQTDTAISSIVLQNAVPVATVDWTTLTAAADQTVSAANITAQTVTANSVYRVIVPPQSAVLTLVVTSSDGKTYTHKLSSAEFKGGKQYGVNIELVKGELKATLSGEIQNWTNAEDVRDDQIDPKPRGATAYVTKVFDYMPAPGQFVNELPEYEPGDTQETMNRKVLEGINGMITLGGFGGYVVVGFDHTIANVPGRRDFRVKGNAGDLDSWNRPYGWKGGFSEPGVIVVSYDANKNGMPDDPWYEIAGSAHVNPKEEEWYDHVVEDRELGNCDNDLRTIFDYEITYHRPTSEPDLTEVDYENTNSNIHPNYIRWENNQGQSGYKSKNAWHHQCYYPLHAKGDKITFKGTRLPQNGVNYGGAGKVDGYGDDQFHFLHAFRYGYADNAPQGHIESAIDIDWAVDANGKKVHLPGVDFIKVYNGMDQENGWIGESSTEVCGIEDLHVLGVVLNTRY